MSVRREWTHKTEAEFERETRAELREVEAQEQEDAEHRVEYDPWQELGGEAA